MMYQTSKLAREIANDLRIKEVCKVWDILDELGYKPQILNKKEVTQWTLKVSKNLFYQ